MWGLGILQLGLTTDKNGYQVGDTPTYILQHAEPGSMIYWTSFKDGLPTGENRQFYEQVVGPLGAVELTGGTWAETDIGRWQKLAYVVAPGGAESLAQAFFTVSPKSAATVPTQPAASSWFDESVDLFGQQINKGVLAGAGVLLAIFFFNKRK